MKYILRKILFPVALLGAFQLSAKAEETASQAQVRAQMARFWQVAETRVAESPPPSGPGRAVEVSPVRPLGRTCAPTGVTLPAPPPSHAPVVEAHQGVQRNEDKGHFGLQIFGGLRLFDFTWGDEHTAETDLLKGRL